MSFGGFASTTSSARRGAPKDSPRDSRNVVEISVAHSDGVPGHYPVAGISVEEMMASEYAYFEEEKPGSSKDLLYRTKLGEAIGSKLLSGLGRFDGASFVLKALPANYKIFTNIKVRGDNKRTDSYVYGHPSGKKFRSTQEIEPHIVHLAMRGIEGLAEPYGGNEEDLGDCPCLNCSKGGGSASQGTTSASRNRKTPQQQLALHGRERDLPVKTKLQLEAIREATKNEWRRDITELRASPRKNELVWAKTGYIWRAAIVCEPYQSDVKLQVCGDNDRLFTAPRHHVRPWIMRPPSSDIDASSKAAAFHAERSVTLIGELDRMSDEEKGTDGVYYSGIFLGSEKVWLEDLIRIPGRNSRTVNDSLNSYPYGNEDVMFVEYILKRNGLEQDPKTNEPRKVSHIFLRGPVFTTDEAKSFDLSEEAKEAFMKCLAPPTSRTWRLQMESGQKSTDADYPGVWRTRMKDLGHGETATAELSFKLVRGRFYPLAYIKPMLGGGGSMVDRPDITDFFETRQAALGVSSINGVELSLKRRRVEG